MMMGGRGVSMTRWNSGRALGFEIADEEDFVFLSRWGRYNGRRGGGVTGFCYKWCSGRLLIILEVIKLLFTISIYIRIHVQTRTSIHLQILTRIETHTRTYTGIHIGLSVRASVLIMLHITNFAFLSLSAAVNTKQNVSAPLITLSFSLVDFRPVSYSHSLLCRTC